ncbi:hypothetical protein J8M20_08575 [Pseudoalteromonas luteoviolacea]|uniref:hypothetical protein n=1 Tax=Pseudoalteromonas luteoviolacea TaxID=43657 RepID=UPI001B388533|nr:hypothetical protein [Pseudoalteromonas luteoviolacea]MBQ4811389.1 hypothetical protein [Pseudoalteromonas luteoviolacea]
MRILALSMMISALIALIIWFSMTPDVNAESMVLGETKLVENKPKAALEVSENKVAELKPNEPIEKMQVETAAQNIAIGYRESLKFAPYSQPLTVNDEDRLNPNKFIPVSTPLFGEEASISLSLNKFRFIKPEPVEVWVEGEGIQKAQIQVGLVGEKKSIHSIEMQVIGGRAQTKLGAKQLPLGDISIKAIADVSGEEVILVAHAKYMQPSARLRGVASTRIEQSDIVISLQMDVEEAGIYRVRANLYDGELPLAHLVGKRKLGEGGEIITLKAHQSVIPKSATALGLKTFVIERMSSVPGEGTRYGTSDITEAALLDVDISKLDRTPYAPSEKELASLAFLEQLAGAKN